MSNYILQLKLGHVWVITSHSFMWPWLLTMPKIPWWFSYIKFKVEACMSNYILWFYVHINIHACSRSHAVSKQKKRVPWLISRSCYQTANYFATGSHDWLRYIWGNVEINLWESRCLLKPTIPVPNAYWWRASTVCNVSIFHLFVAKIWCEEPKHTEQ